ncbi:hypothetical protein EHS19_01105 [Bifidobacterium jacchi]|uniref:DUF559 domain-containing protein n=2 Tax=Bifidobacterium jacchi TaxID=2490545 RepID=A0A5N5RMK6_9BIFI|nr:hypothetical protein EHS19_01105 [Bifidobacterium jacchi]
MPLSEYNLIISAANTDNKRAVIHISTFFGRSDASGRSIRYGRHMDTTINALEQYPTIAQPDNTHGNAHAPTLYETLAQQRQQMMERCSRLAANSNEQVAFCMTTALALLEIPPPSCPTISNDVLHTVSTTTNDRIGRYDGGVQPHVWRFASDDPQAFVQINRSILALHPSHVWAQMSAQLSLEELIVLGDAIVANAKRRYVYRPLTKYVRRISGFNGRRRCLKALTYMRSRVGSPMESRLRISINRHGVPLPATGYEVPGEFFDSGVPMTLDIAWPQYKVAIEYDGDHHRTDKQQWRRDQYKRERIRSRGWIVIIATAGNLGSESRQAEFAFLVARYLMQRGAQFTFFPCAQDLK